MKNLRPYFVSLVDKAANRREFLIRKENDGGSEEYVQVPIFKRDDMNDDGTRYVTGVVYEPGTIDTQGDCMTAVEIEKAAHWYMRNHQGVDVRHSFEPAGGCFVAESTVHKAATTIAGNEIPEGAWTMTIGIENPTIIAKIDSGELNGLSIGGVAQYELTHKSADDEEPPGWFQRFVAKFTGSKAKDEDPPRPNNDDDDEDEKKEDQLMTKSDVQDVASAVVASLVENGVVAKAATEDKQKDKPVAKSAEQADVAALVAKGIADGFAEVAKAVSAQTAAEPASETAPKAAETAPQPDTQVEKAADAPAVLTNGELQAVIKSAVTDAIAAQVAPLQAQVDQIAKAGNIPAPSNLNGTANVQKSATPHYMDNIISA